MKGDFSRQTFDPSKHYNGVLMQQGRVQVDADWNEQQAILRYRSETEALDVIGECGAPDTLPGFSITAQDKVLQIGGGRYYVDGILCANGMTNDFSLPYTQQPDLPNPPDVVALLKDLPTPLGLVYLDVWQRHLTALDDHAIREQALGGPDTATRIKTVWQVKVLAVTLDLSPLLAELKKAQDELQKIAGVGDATFQAAVKPWLDKVTNFLTSPDAKALEKVLTFYSDVVVALLSLVNLAPNPAVKEELGKLALEMEGSFLSYKTRFCKQAFLEWDALLSSSTGKLKAQTNPAASTDNPCLIPPSAGYQRLENQLYRVEVHRGGDTSKDTVTFVWSRDNGSVVTSIVAPAKANDTTVTVGDLGPDDELGFATTQTVEVLDDRLDLNGQPGQLVTIRDINRATRVVTFDQALNAAVDATLHAKIRRWDGVGQVTVPANAKATDWLSLEGGIQVQFAAGTYKTGDYWLIPARTASGTIEWPLSPTDTLPLAEPPLGIRHHYCRLALVLLQTAIASISSSPSTTGTVILLARGGTDVTPTPVRTSAHPLPIFSNVLNTINAARVAHITGSELVLTPGSAPTVPPAAFQVWDCRTFFPPLTAVPPAMHVIHTNWQNDDLFSPQQFLSQGLNIILDAEPEQVSVSPVTVIVTLEISAALVLGQAGIGNEFDLSLIIHGVTTVESNVIHWTFQLGTTGVAANERLLGNLSRFASAARNVIPRIRVTLKGHDIWSKQSTRLYYLDGQAFGESALRTDGKTPRTALILPSGAGTLASDFESWFYLGEPPTPAPLRISTINFISVDPNQRETIIHSVDLTQVPTTSTPPPTLPTVQFGDAVPVNVIEITFNHPITPDGIGSIGKPQSIVVTQQPAGPAAGPSTVSGDIQFKPNTNDTVVRFLARDPSSFIVGSYTLTVFGSVHANVGPAIKEKDGAILDGDFDGKPGGDFVLPFEVFISLT